MDAQFGSPVRWPFYVALVVARHLQRSAFNQLRRIVSVPSLKACPYCTESMIPALFDFTARRSPLHVALRYNFSVKGSVYHRSGRVVLDPEGRSRTLMLLSKTIVFDIQPEPQSSPQEQRLE